MMAAKRAKLVKGQTILWGNSVEMMKSSSLDVTPPAKCRGVVDSWRSFNQAKWKTKYPWIEIKHDGVYCSYCRKGATRGASIGVVASLLSLSLTQVYVQMFYCATKANQSYIRKACDYIVNLSSVNTKVRV